MLTGIILAGGENKRMGGENKALLKFDGETLFERQFHKMAEVCSEIIVVTSQPLVYKELIREEWFDGRVSFVMDKVPGLGPLGGMEAGFSDCRSEFAWVVGCDYPFLSPAAAELMVTVLQTIEQAAAIPVIGDQHQMLHAVYRPVDCRQVVRQLLDQRELRLSGLLTHISWHRLDDDIWAQAGLSTQFAQDVDTPAQYAEAAKRN